LQLTAISPRCRHWIVADCIGKMHSADTSNPYTIRLLVCPVGRIGANSSCNRHKGTWASGREGVLPNLNREITFQRRLDLSP
jgi:hypothetical protein